MLSTLCSVDASGAIASAVGDSSCFSSSLNIPDLVGTVLDATVTRSRQILADGFQDNCVTLFHAQVDPSISMASYITRIQQFGKPAPNSMLYAVILMDRVMAALPPPFLLSGFNIHRLYGCCVLLSSKSLDDIFYSNTHWGKVLGISLGELNNLEREALGLLHWRVHVSAEQFESYTQALVQRARALTATAAEEQFASSMLRAEPAVASHTDDSDCDTPYSTASSSFSAYGSLDGSFDDERSNQSTPCKGKLPNFDTLFCCDEHSSSSNMATSTSSTASSSSPMVDEEKCDNRMHRKSSSSNKGSKRTRAATKNRVASPGAASSVMGTSSHHQRARVGRA